VLFLLLVFVTFLAAELRVAITQKSVLTGSIYDGPLTQGQL